MCKKKNLKEFIIDAKRIHCNDDYIYTEGEYINNYTPIKIICPIHGEFWQTPNSHLRGRGCPKCGLEKIRIPKDTFEDFVEKSRKIHGDEYQYHEDTYINNRIKTKITCSIHGEFWQTPNGHLQGHKCPKCSKISRDLKHIKTTKQFILDAKKVHGDDYIYTESEYKGKDIKVAIICPKHGIFWQTPEKHVTYKQGCPKCKATRLEKEVINLLQEKDINYDYDTSLKPIKNKRIDFYLPKHNIVIECQGEQHFRPVDFANKGEEWANKKFQSIIECDEYKHKELTENGIDVIYYTNIKKIPKEFTDKHIYLTSIDDVLEIIKQKEIPSTQ